MQSSPSSCYFLPFRSKYSPEHPVLKHSQFMFSSCESLCFKDLYLLFNPIN
jgi:hypothetical protein